MIFLLIGIIAGIITGVSGISGPILFPMLMLAGMSARESLAAVLVMHVLPVSIPALYMYYTKSSSIFRFRDIAMIAIGMLVGIFFGAYVITANNVSDTTMTRIIAGIMIVLSIGMVVKTL
jgi:uncharacterized membrane protein YfcA